MRHLPNALSLTRIVLSLAMLFCRERIVLFTALYLLCGVSDLADGWAARRFGWQSRLGAALDSLGDGVFWAVVLYLLLAFFRPPIRRWMWVLFVVALLQRLVNFAVTRVRFGKWGMLHSWGNRLAGLLLYLLVPVCILLGRVPLAAAIILGAAASLSALEELLILLDSEPYNPDRRSLLGRKKV